MNAKITLLALLSVVVIGCSIDSDENINNGPTANFDIGVIDDGNNNNNNSTLAETDLLAGQNTDSGDVVVTIVDGYVVVTYNTDPEWEIQETHLFVGDINDLPLNTPGNPQIGQFPYSGTHVAGTYTMSYTTTIFLEPGDCVIIAAHAVVYNSGLNQTETAWGAGDPMGGNSWAMTFEVCN
jgi:hypothetical protein